MALVSSAEETAQDLHHALLENNLLRPPGGAAPTHIFAATKDAQAFQELAQRFLGPVVQSAAQVSI